MLENLTERMSRIVRNLRGVGRLDETNIAAALKEVRTALLGSDVHFKVVREFVEQVKEKCIGQEVARSITPGQQVIKVIHDELIELLGSGPVELQAKKPLRIMMVGLHGSGKTTSSVKLARFLSKKGYTPILIACDVHRPAAIDQLEILAQQENFLFYADRDTKDVLEIGKKGLEGGHRSGADVSIFDTAGRLQMDAMLIDEVKRLRKAVNPHETLLVADSALGQEAVSVAAHFHEAIDLTGVVLTKLDGDARGGAALSMKAMTQVPLKFMGTGEKIDDFDTFYPERMASRILGMGDVVSLVEKAQETMDQKQAERLEKKMRRADLNLEDFLDQLKKLKNMGPLENLVSMIPGMSGVQIGDAEKSRFKRTEAVIQSMTPKERQNPQILNGSRRVRIAKGSGVEVKDVNAVLKQFQQMRKMMKGSKLKKMKKAMEMMGGDISGFPFNS